MVLVDFLQGKPTIELSNDLCLPVAICQSFSTVARSPNHVAMKSLYYAR